MNFQTLQRFAPLLNFVTKQSSELSDSDLKTVATALADGDSPEFLSVLMSLREAEPTQRIAGILSSPTAKKMFASLTEGTAEKDRCLFAKCPACGINFETTLG